jgi:hypothetical protein
MQSNIGIMASQGIRYLSGFLSFFKIIEVNNVMMGPVRIVEGEGLLIFPGPMANNFNRQTKSKSKSDSLPQGLLLYKSKYHHDKAEYANHNC